MKYIKTFENLDDDIKVGDIVVAIDNRYAFKEKWITTGTKYKIIYIERAFFSNQEDRIRVEGLNGETYFKHFHKDLFISEAEFDSKKYNL